MISEIITKKDCAKCKKCCQFESGKFDDVPRFSKRLTSQIKNKFGNRIVFTNKTDFYNVKLQKISESKYQCPFLDIEKGCQLSDSRPFDCKIFPFYLMNYKGDTVISISKDCPVIMEKKLSLLYNYFENTINHYISNLLKDGDFIVEPYHSDAIILKILNNNIINK